MAWIIQNNELTNTDFPVQPGKPFAGDAPYTFWRVDSNANDGMPYIGLMTGLPVLAPEPPVEIDLYFRDIVPDSLFYGAYTVTDAYWGSRKVY